MISFVVSVAPAFWLSLFGWFWLRSSEVAGAAASSGLLRSCLWLLGWEDLNGSGLGLLGLHRHLSVCLHGLSLWFLWQSGFHAPKEDTARERQAEAILPLMN